MTRRPRIGLFIDTFFPMVDGVIMVVDNYARRLQKYCDVTVFAPKGRKDYDDSQLPYKVVRCNSKFPLVFLDYDLPLPNLDKKFKEELEKANLDLVHIHSPFSIGKLGVNYAKSHNIPVVATMHSQFKKDFRRAVKLEWVANLMVKKVMKVFNACDECWCMNKGCEILVRSYGFNGITKIIPNGTDLSINEEIKELAQNIKNQYAPNGEKILISVGRIDKLKNLDLTFEVAKELKLKGFKYHLLILGTGKDLEYFKQKVKNLGIEEDVTFLGKITDATQKSAYYMASDLHVFPSLYDTDGIVKIEAAAFNTPTIFSKESMANTNCKDGENGYISEFDKDAFAKKILEIFSNEEQYKTVCLNCHNDIYITWDQILNTVLERYITLMKLNKRGEKK